MYLKKLLPYFIFFCLSLFIANSFGYTMFNDGWRHLAMALNQEEIVSWDRILIHSLYTDYDPWFIWHNFLKLLITVFNQQYTPIIVNFIAYFLLSCWYFIVLKRNTKINFYFLILISIFIPMLNEKYFQLRPDMVAGLLLLYLILTEKKLIYIITFIFAPLYYLFWFFLGYIMVVKIVLKKYKNALFIFIAIVIGFLIYLVNNYEGYIHILELVFNNDKLTSNFIIDENIPVIIPLQLKNLLGSQTLLLILFLFSLLFLYIVNPKNEIFKYFILFLPLMLIQKRFLNLFEPLFFVVLIILAIYIIKYIQTNGVKKPIENIVLFIDKKTYFGLIKKKHFYFLSFLFLFFIFLYTFSIYKNKYTNQYKYILSHKFISDEEFKNKRIFINKMYTLMDISFLYNPTAKYLPNFSLGWVDYNTTYKENYFKILSNNKRISEKELIDFLNFNEVDYFIIDTKFKTNLMITNEKMNKNNYKFYKIIDDYIIFKKDKK